MVKLIEPMNGGKPSHYIINNSKGALNTTYNNLEEFNEAIIIDSILYGKENIENGEIEDLKEYTLFNELDTQGGDVRVDNRAMIESNGQSYIKG